MTDPDLDQLIAPLRDRPPAPARSIDHVTKAASQLRRARRRRRGLGAGGVLALVVLVLGALVFAERGEGPVKLDVAGPITTESPGGPTTTSRAEETSPMGGPELRIEPAGHLSDGQSVVVTGTGFTPDQLIAMSMCEPGVTIENSTSLCEVNAVQNIAADANGEISGTYKVLRIIRIESGVVDCAEGPGRCVLGAADLRFGKAVATVPLTFGAVGPGPSGEHVTAVRTEDLRDDEPVKLRGAGFRPGDDVYISQCGVAEPVLDDNTCSDYAHATAPVRVLADEAGTFTATFPAQRLLFRSATGGFDDCAQLSGGCELRAGTLRSNPVRLPISFELTEPRPSEPSITIDEPLPLLLGQEVTVRGHDFQPGMSIGLRNCHFPEGESSNLSTCTYPDTGSATADASGSFVVTLPVSIDARCDDGPGRCGLAYYPGEGTPAYVRLPLDFASPQPNE